MKAVIMSGYQGYIYIHIHMDVQHPQKFTGCLWRQEQLPRVMCTDGQRSLKKRKPANQTVGDH